MTNTSNILKEMATLTALSGRISEIQIYNLKMYPLVFFNDVESVTIDYDLTSIKSIEDEPAKNNLLICYYIQINESKNDDLDKRFKALEQSIRTLFWNDIIIEIYFNNKIKYKSSKNERQ